jgi:hypothetical protein
MAQLSRTYQVILVLVAVLALAWFTVLHNQISGGSGSSSSSSSSSSGATQSAQSSSQGASGAAQAGSVSRNEGAPTRVYHGPVPGLHGLSKDIRRAHEAVSTSEAQSRRVESTSGSTPSPGTRSSSSAAANGHGNPATQTSSSRPHGAATGSASRSAGARSSGAGAHRGRGHADPRALTVSRQLRQGKVVLLLFWKSKSFDDQAVHAQLQAVSRTLGRRIAVDYAKPSEVGAFGTVTADIRVLQTPTLLVIDKKGLTTTITGLTDAFSVEQAVREAR